MCHVLKSQSVLGREIVGFLGWRDWISGRVGCAQDAKIGSM